jgi:ABC-type Zn uptake system ZnuABC Zn-binding protein ZnuA
MKQSFSFIAVFLALVCLFLTGCRNKDAPAPRIAVTCSYFECAVHDLLDANTPVIRMAEPGMCPGHFDMRPNQVTELRQCRLLIRFDFQDSLDGQLGNPATLTMASISLKSGMCVPDSYVSTCRQVADAMVRAGLIDSSTANARLAAIEKRLAQISENAQTKVQHAGLTQRPIITTGHQAEFCRWLKLDVLAAIGGADAASVKQIDTAISTARKANCRLVIANRPEGTQLPSRIAEELQGQMVVFDNFPDLSPRQSSFDAMLLDNVDRLVKAAQ